MNVEWLGLVVIPNNKYRSRLIVEFGNCLQRDGYDRHWFFVDVPYLEDGRTSYGIEFAFRVGTIEEGFSAAQALFEEVNAYGLIDRASVYSNSIFVRKDESTTEYLREVFIEGMIDHSFRAYECYKQSGSIARARVAAELLAVLREMIDVLHIDTALIWISQWIEWHRLHRSLTAEGDDIQASLASFEKGKFTLKREPRDYQLPLHLVLPTLARLVHIQIIRLLGGITCAPVEEEVGIINDCRRFFTVS